MFVAKPIAIFGSCFFFGPGTPKVLAIQSMAKRKMVGTNGHKIGHVEYLTIRFFGWYPPAIKRGNGKFTKTMSHWNLN